MHLTRFLCAVHFFLYTYVHDFFFFFCKILDYGFVRLPRDRICLRFPKCPKAFQAKFQGFSIFIVPPDTYYNGVIIAAWFPGSKTGPAHTTTPHLQGPLGRVFLATTLGQLTNHFFPCVRLLVVPTRLRRRTNNTMFESNLRISNLEFPISVDEVPSYLGKARLIPLIPLIPSMETKAQY